jgi:Fe-S-cluster containining protein
VRRLLQRLRGRKHASTLEVPPKVAEEASNFLLEMDEALEEITGLRGLDEFPRTRRIPPRTLPLWQKALGAYDRYVETMVRGSGLEVRCTLGCVACCHDVPNGVQAIELLNIYLVYREFSDFTAIHDRIRELSDSGEQPPCAFLDPSTKRCRIYEARPISCRMHVSVTDPDWCSVDHPKAADAVTRDVSPPEAILDIMKQIGDRLGLGHLSPSLLQGLATLCGEIMNGEKIEVRAELRRRGRGDSSR